MSIKIMLQVSLIRESFTSGASMHLEDVELEIEIRTLSNLSYGSPRK